MLWNALPPELNTARLMAGAGAAPALQAASGWEALGAALEAQADGVAASLVSLGEMWSGAGSDRALAAAAPMVIWLRGAAQVAHTRAAQATAQAGAYLQALAMTPSLPEIAANHVTHAVLAATNFLGINTVPIGANEADYFIRMWNQAASAMDVYQAETMLNTAFEKLEPMTAILDQNVGQLANDVAEEVAQASSQVPLFPVADLPIQPAMSGSVLQLLQPLQAVTSLFSLGSSMGGAVSPLGGAAGAESAAQVGLVGASPLSSHPLAGGSGPRTGAGLLRAVSMPGAGGTLVRTPLIGGLLDKPADPAVAPVAAAGSSATSGAAPVGGTGLGRAAGAGESSRPGPAVSVTLTREPDEVDDDWDDDDDW